MSVYSGVRPSTLFESAEVDFTDVKPLNGSILELAVECEQNDMNLFEAVIEMDFMEAASLLEADEATDDDEKKDKEDKTSSTSDEAEKTIWEKIKDLLKKAWEKIKSFFAGIIAKIQQLIGNDAALYAKYEKYWNAANLKGFKISNYAPLKFSSNDLNGIAGAYVDNIYNSMNEALETISKATDTDGAAKEYFKNSMERLRGGKSWADSMKEDIVGEKIEKETELVSINGGDQIDLIKDMMKDGKKIIQGCKAMSKYLSVELKFNAKYQKAARSGKKGLALAKANGTYKTYNAAVKEISQCSGAFCAAITKALGSARKAFITGGKYAKNKADGKENSTNESAYIAFNSMIGDISDAYVESVMYGF